MIIYKINVLEALKNAGYNTNCLRKNQILSEGSIQALRHGQAISFKSLDTICRLLNIQPADIIEYVADDTDN